ncbi:hypothetical protein SDC9_142646 [bioreactor metagenome]|uniref:Uncharacterized protein n=1 Tax=bioreactor metagenome TaxID=1076179 RepID=A0A645E4J3_9ZZZZ
MPPHVIIASSIGRVPFTVNRRSFSVFPSAERSAFVNSSTVRSPEISDNRTITEIMLCGSRSPSAFLYCFLGAALKSRSIRLSSCSYVSAGFRSISKYAGASGFKWLLAESTSGPDTPKCVKSISPCSEYTCLFCTNNVRRTFLSDNPVNS